MITFRVGDEVEHTVHGWKGVVTWVNKDKRRAQVLLQDKREIICPFIRLKRSFDKASEVFDKKYATEERKKIDDMISSVAEMIDEENDFNVSFLVDGTDEPDDDENGELAFA